MKRAAMLLLIVVSLSVIPNASCQNMDKPTDAKKQPANTSTPVKQQPTADIHQGDGNKPIQTTDKQYSVAIKEMPPKDHWDQVYVVLTAILVCIGGATFIAVWKQAVQTRTAAGAMLLQIEIQRESLRPRLVIKPASDPYPDMALGKLILVDVSVVNTGGIPAYGVDVETWLEFLDLPFVDFTGDATHYQGRKLSIHPTQPTNYQVPLRRALGADEIAKLRAAKGTLHLRILLTYDALGKCGETDTTFGITPNGWEICKTDHT